MPPEHRLQILLDNARYERIASVACKRGVSVATVVREAIDRAVGGPRGDRVSAAQRLLDAPDMPVPSPAELKHELDSRGRRV